MKTFNLYQNRRLIDDKGSIANGDYIKEEVTIRVSNGYLNDVIDEDGNLLPAIQMHDLSHYEHWKNGLLHNENGPAVVDLTPEESREEWWLNGQKIKAPIMDKEKL